MSDSIMNQPISNLDYNLNFGGYMLLKKILFVVPMYNITLRMFHVSICMFVFTYASYVRLYTYILIFIETYRKCMEE